MATAIHGPKLLKGALVSAPYDGSSASVIPFQYNPEMLSRNLSPQYIGGEQLDQADMVRFDGAPVETIDAEVEIDATDALEANDPNTVKMGIHPQLAALELLIYPTTTYMKTIEANLLQSGTTEIVPPLVPLTLFVWGSLRVVPVRIDSMSITEDAHDALLNPIRATVSLSMRVLSYSDLAYNSIGYELFLAYQTKLEQIALVETASNENQAVTSQTTMS